MVTLTQLDLAIADAQNNLAKLQAQRNKLADLISAATALRPAGIDPTWMPAFDIQNQTVLVNAWFNPAKYGNNFGAQ